MKQISISSEMRRLRSARKNSIGKYYTIYEGIKFAETSMFICFDDDLKVQA